MRLNCLQRDQTDARKGPRGLLNRRLTKGIVGRLGPKHVEECRCVLPLSQRGPLSRFVISGKSRLLLVLCEKKLRDGMQSVRL